MMIRSGSISHVLGQLRLSAAMVAAALVVSPAAGQTYRADFEGPTYTGSAPGILLAGQGGWTTPPGSIDFGVYTQSSGALGIPISPTGGGQLAAGIGPGGQLCRAEHAIDFIGPGLFDISADLCVRYSGELPAANFIGSLSLQPITTSAAFNTILSWDDPENPSTFSILYQVFDSEGSAAQLEPGAVGAFLLSERWYHLRTRVDFTSNRVLQIEVKDIATGQSDVYEPTDWYLRGGSGGELPRPSALRLFAGSAAVAGNIAAFDNVDVAEPALGNILAFGLEHEPLNGATLAFDVEGNLVVTTGGGPGAGDEDVSVHLNDGAGMSFAPSPDSDLSQLGQKVTSTLRGTVNNVPGTLVARSTIRGTGTSALLSVDFPIAPEEGQRARLYDDRNRLIASVIVPNASAFTLTSPTRGQATVTKSASNIKNNFAAPQPEHTDEFGSDMDVTHPSWPGEVWHEVRKVAIQSVSKQGEPIRNVDFNFGKKPVGSGLVIQQEAADLPVAGSPKGSASFSTVGQAVIASIKQDLVIFIEAPGGGPALFGISDRGLPGELRRPKKRAEVEMETPPVSPLAEGSYLKTTAHLLVKGLPFPPNRYQVAVTETKVGGPLPVEISADFTDLGSTTHRVTVLLDGVVLGVHSGVGPVIGYAEDFVTARDVSPAIPITRGPGQPVKGISVGLSKEPFPIVQISGIFYDADEIRIEPEFPSATVEAIDDLSLQSQGLGSVTVTSATFEDSALLVGGLPVSLIGTEGELDLDTQDHLALAPYHIGGTGQDGYTIDLSVNPLGYATQVPRLPGGGTSESRYDLDVTTDTVSVLVSSAGGGDDLAFEPITPGGTYGLRAYKKGLKVYSADGRTGVAVVLAGGTKPVPMEQFIEEIEGTMYLVQALSISAGTGEAFIDFLAQDADEIQILTAVAPGAAIRKLDYRLSTDRADAVVHADHAVLGPGRMPIAALGEGKLERIGGQLAVTGLTGSGGDGVQAKVAIKEKGVQVAGASWLPSDVTAAAGSSITTTGLFAGILDPTTTYAIQKSDTKSAVKPGWDVREDKAVLVHVEVLSGGVLVAEMPGHGPDIGLAGAAPIGAGASTVWPLGGEGACVSSYYPAATQFVIDGQTYSGDQLVVGVEGRAATDMLMGLSVTTVGYERLVFGEFSFEPIPLCLADMNDDGLVDFADYLDFLNFYDAQDLHVDFNQDGLVDFADYLEFLNLYDAGC